MLVGIERDIFHLLRLLSRLTPPSVSPTPTVRPARGRRSAFMPSKPRPAPKWLICRSRSGHNPGPMITLLLHLLRLLPFLFGGHRQLALENLALRQQLAVYKRLAPEAPPGRPSILGRAGQNLDQMETVSHHRHPGHRPAMAAPLPPSVRGGVPT